MKTILESCQKMWVPPSAYCNQVCKMTKLKSFVDTLRIKIMSNELSSVDTEDENTLQLSKLKDN